MIAILGLHGPDRIVQVTDLNPTNLKEFLTDKAAILDIKAVDEKGQHYNIKLQVQPEEF